MLSQTGKKRRNIESLKKNKTERERGNSGNRSVNQERNGEGMKMLERRREGKRGGR